MSRGYTLASIAGNVGEPIKYNRTKNSREECCSFRVCSEDRDGSTTWCKVNVYGEGNVKMCRMHLKRGGYVTLTGSLMNRLINGEQVLEVRGKEVIFRPPFQRDDRRNENGIDDRDWGSDWEEDKEGEGQGSRD